MRKKKLILQVKIMCEGDYDNNRWGRGIMGRLAGRGAKGFLKKVKSTITWSRCLEGKSPTQWSTCYFFLGAHPQLRFYRQYERPSSPSRNHRQDR